MNDLIHEPCPIHDTPPQRELIQLVPPGEGGVVDYAKCLKAQWATQGVASQLLPWSRETAAGIDVALGVANNGQGSVPCTLVLHYSGYGYAQRGLCFWLIDELQALRARHAAGVRVVSVFHELFACGPPWRSAFWLSPAQALIAARLARLSDALWTNTEQHARWLRRVVGSEKVIGVRPVFSNIGEPTAVPSASQRRPVAVVFGSQSTRQRAFSALRGNEAKLRRLGVEALIEVGSGNLGGDTTFPCTSAGRLAAPELCELLLQSRFGVLDYPPQFLGKSGVFAAYAAHGCVALNTCRPGPDTDRLVAGLDYISLEGLTEATAATASPSAMSARVSRWYAGHRLADQASELLLLATHNQSAVAAATSVGIGLTQNDLHRAQQNPNVQSQ